MIQPVPVPDKAGARAILGLPNTELLTIANARTESVFGKKVDLCAIINIRSGHCGMNCAFCVQSTRSTAPIATWPMLDNKNLTNRINDLAKLPVNHIGLVASGESLSRADFDRLLELIAATPATIRKRLCVSIGHLTMSHLKQFQAAGLTHIHHNLETSETYYPTVCTSQNWNERLYTVRQAIRAGMEVCSGALFGIGESWQDRADLALTLAREGVKNIPLNFLFPQPGTPLAKRKPISAQEALRIIALFRYILPKATLRICGGRPLTFKDRQRDIFFAGANALMTGDYLTTTGMNIEHDLKLLNELDLTPGD